MKPIDAQNHYEVLEVAVDAPLEEIERSYRLVRAAYTNESMALYSVFDEPSAESIRDRLDIAYRVLSDADERRRYDVEVLRREEELPPPPPEEAQPARQPGALEPMEAVEELEEDEGGQDFDGARLRRARLRRGIELSEIAAVTKINPSYLEYIEAERYDDLPDPVYVRGFVGAYARAIGLEAGRVAAGYMGRLEESRRARRPGRLLGRR